MDHDSIGSDDLVGAVKVPLYEVDQTKAVTLRRLLGNGSDVSILNFVGDRGDVSIFVGDRCVLG